MALIVAVIILWIICYFAPSLLSWELPEWMPWGFNSFLIAFLVIGAVFVLAAYVSEGQIGSAKYRAIQKAHSENPTSVCPQCGSRNITVYRKGYDYNKGFWYSMFKVRGGMYLAGMDRNKAMCACRDCNHRWETDREILVGGGRHQTGEAVTENDAPPSVNRKKHLKIWAVAAVILAIIVVGVNTAGFYDNGWKDSFDVKTYGLNVVYITNVSDDDYDEVSIALLYQYSNNMSRRYDTEPITLKQGESKTIILDLEDVVKSVEEKSPNSSFIIRSAESVEVFKVIYS